MMKFALEQDETKILTQDDPKAMALLLGKAQVAMFELNKVNQETSAILKE